jgi:hypothetical protein
MSIEMVEYLFNIGMRGEQAKELCPDFHVFHVQEVNGKANLTR